MSGPTFLGLPAVELDALEPGGAEVVMLGIPHGVPYPHPGLTAGCAEAPPAVRHRSQRLARFIDGHDFDLDGPMLPPDRPLRILDAGDVPGAPEDGARNMARTEAAVRAILAASAIPLALGGDDSVPIPFLRAFDAHAPLTVLHVDAHLDFRDAVDGVHHGYSSPMRRASEMEHVARIVQVGLRGLGSARPEDVSAARAADNLLVTAGQVAQRGVPWVLSQLPAGGSLVVSFDCDGLDPSVCPAVSAQSPGGLGYDQAAELLAGAAAHPGFAGLVVTELVPALDINDLSALVVTRLLMRVLGTIARS